MRQGSLQQIWLQNCKAEGSHIILKKETEAGSVGTVVPMHKELKIGTLKGVLELAKIDEKEFAKYQ